MAPPLLLLREKSWNEAVVWYKRAIDADSTGTAITAHSWVYLTHCFTTSEHLNTVLVVGE